MKSSRKPNDINIANFYHFLLRTAVFYIIKINISITRTKYFSNFSEIFYREIENGETSKSFDADFRDNEYFGSFAQKIMTNSPDNNLDLS